MLSGHSSPAAIYGTAIAFTVVSGLVLVARLLTRFLVARQAGLDDAFISMGWVGLQPTLTKTRASADSVKDFLCTHGCRHLQPSFLRNGCPHLDYYR